MYVSSTVKGHAFATLAASSAVAIAAIAARAHGHARPTGRPRSTDGVSGTARRLLA